jgi:hypothetical protein
MKTTSVLTAAALVAGVSAVGFIELDECTVSENLLVDILFKLKLTQVFFYYLAGVS